MGLRADKTEQKQRLEKWKIGQQKAKEKPRSKNKKKKNITKTYTQKSIKKKNWGIKKNDLKSILPRRGGKKKTGIGCGLYLPNVSFYSLMFLLLWKN